MTGHRASVASPVADVTSGATITPENTPATPENTPANPGAERLYGRRRGHKLRLGQQVLMDEVLPRLRVGLDQLAALGPRGMFSKPVTGAWLEIGFGGGEHLAAQAAAHPDIGLIGCEVYENGIVTLLAALDRRVAAGAPALDNLRLMVEDARRVLDALPVASIDRVFVLFPDPWRKARHHKRRLISRSTLDRLAVVMADGAELRLATDHVDYLRQMLSLAPIHPAFDWQVQGPADWRHRPDDWPQTRYERKGIEAGRPPTFLRLRRRPRNTSEG
ncbi:MAG TPA: tRNA (guanine(46)-N(7))-methyltransferase TrmB [Stellaceae bacterium]|nr:tRNA (guanine(46)-N(7))-methyltransferase TrmB [Stellaceae bacterium]